MRELHVKTVVLEDELGRNRCYEYAILIDEMRVGSFPCESYGLKVSEQGGARCAVPNITVSAGRIDELCELVIAGGVTPVTLKDVVEDWL